MTEVDGFNYSRLPLVVAAASSVIFILLYLIAPVETSAQLRSGNTAWLMWTPLILISLGSAVTSFTFASLKQTLSARELIIGSAVMMTLITIGHQFGVSSPIGADGWFFTELSLRHYQFGNAIVIDSYLIRPGVLLLVEWSWRLLPSMAPLLASIVGVLLSFALFLTMCSALHHSSLEGQRIWLPVVAAGFAGLMLSGWNPAQFSAQLLALVLWFWIVHHRLKVGAHRDRMVWAAIILMVITHLFTPLFLFSVLFFEGRMKDERGRSARILASGGFALWIVWAVGPAAENTAGLLSAAGTPLPMALIVLFSALILFILILYAWRHPGGVETEDVGIKIENICWGILSIVPLLLLAESVLGVRSFLPRMATLLFVPLGLLLMKIPSQIKVQGWIENGIPRQQISAILAISLLVGAAMSIAHGQWVERSMVMPKETSQCWDAAEDSGLWGLIDLGGNRWFIAHSPQLRPPTDNGTFRDLFDSIGEGKDRPMESIGAIIETVDMAERMNIEGYSQEWQQWDEHESIDGVCKIFVRPEISSELTPGAWG